MNSISLLMQTDTKTINKMNLRNLRLKKFCSNSCQDNSDSNKQDCHESDTNDKKINNRDKSVDKKNMFNSLNDDDSLADFESPKKYIVQKPNLIKFKIDNSKDKKKVLKSKSKVKSRKKTSKSKQPSIESSFFKPQTPDQKEVQKSIPCPLCLKPFKDDATCTNHMKTCASKNNVSTKELIRAKLLQDRQIQERKAMGLLPTPIIPEKKKVFRSRNFSTSDDPQLQLALAVSESLYQAERKVELEETALLAGIPSICIKDMTDEDQCSTLQSFGFTTNKPLNDFSTNRSKKKKLLGPTVLQIRSKEDKDRVLTERIVCILTGDDAFTQPVQNTDIITESKSPTVLKSKLLQDIQQVNNKLWDKSKLIEKCEFYVEELKSHIEPQENEIIDWNILDGDKNDEQDIISKNCLVPEAMDIDIVYDKNREQGTANSTSFNQSNVENWELSYVNNIISDWRKGLNDRGTSDIIIFLKNNKYVYAHKLVFHTRQSNILLEIEPNDTDIDSHIQNKICLFENDKLPTLAFLEYMYCGNIETNSSIFDDDNLLCQVKKLGKLYPVKDLFHYLERKQKKYSNKKSIGYKSAANDNNTSSLLNNVTDNQISIDTPIKKRNISNIHENNSPEIQPIKVIDSEPKSNLSPSLSESIINDKLSNYENKLKYSDRRLSPDLFDSENDDEKRYSCNTQKNNDTKTTESKKNSSETKCINSEIVEISSPDTNISSSEDIYRAVTPKKLSPQNYFDTNLDNSVISENVESEIDHITKAATPKSDTSSRLAYCTTPKKAVYANIEIDNRDKEIEDDYLIHTAVTPPRSESAEKNPQKLKSNLSLFIDKVQKKNAKCIFDSDSEGDTPELQKEKRNPFLKKYRNDSFNYLLNNKSKNIEHKRVLSLLEKDILEDEEVNEIERNSRKNRRSNNSQMQDVSTNNFLNIDVNINSQVSSTSESQNIELLCTESSKSNSENKNEESLNLLLCDDESEISMYSRYKRANKHENSIEKYRNVLKLNNIFSSTILQQELSKNNSATKTNSRFDDVTLVSDSDDEEKASAISNFNNVYSYSRHIVNNKIDQSAITTRKKPLSKKNSKSKVIDSVLNSNKNSDSESTNSLVTDSNDLSKRNNKSRHEEFLEISEKKNDDVDAEIQKILESSPDFTTKNATLHGKQSKIGNREKFTQETNKVSNDTNHSNQCEIINLSPISIISSPEPCKSNNEDPVQSNKNKNKFIFDTSTELQTEDFDLIENRYFDDFNKEFTLRKENDNDQNDASKSSLDSNGCKENNQDVSLKNKNKKFNFSTSKNSCMSSLLSSPILSQNSKTIHALPSTSNLSQRSESPGLISKKTRRLTIKSASTSNFAKKTEQFNKCTLKKSSSFVTPEQNNKLQQSCSRYEEGITPPVDYNLLDTPSLKRELSKFGLKNQSRSKATLLLKHIYEQTHPLVALSQKRTSVYNSSSDDEEPLSIKQNSRKKFKRNISKLDAGKSELLQNCPKIVEEMNYDEPNIVNNLKNPVNIKDAFFKLIESNKELYTKILTYEPVPLESLHFILKENGVKCKLSELENFLDDQCITYQVQNDRKWYRK